MGRVGRSRGARNRAAAARRSRRSIRTLGRKMRSESQPRKTHRHLELGGVVPAGALGQLLSWRLRWSSRLERKRMGRTRRTAARKRTGGGMRTRRIRQPLVTGNAERRHVPRPGDFVPKRGTGTRRDEAWYDGGTRIGGKQDGRAKVKPRACLGLPLLPPAPAAGAARCRTVRARCPPHRLPLPCARHRSSPSVVARRATCPPPLAAEPPSRVVRLAGVTEGKRLR
jgi:hypothetical protein